MTDSGVLHTLDASPDTKAYRDCLRLLRPADAVLLLGDGVYALQPNTAFCSALAASGASVYILASDARLAGIAVDAEAVTPVSIEGFVALTERYGRQMAWY